MNANYDVGQRHWFIRLVKAASAVPMSSDLLERDVEKLCWLHDIADIEMVNLLCYTHQYIDGQHHFCFRGHTGQPWTSLPQEYEDLVEWRVVRPRGDLTAVYTSFVPVQQYVLSLIHNDGKKHPQWVSDRAKIFQEKLDLLLKQKDLQTEGWQQEKLTLSKGSDGNQPYGHLPSCMCPTCTRK